MRRDIIDPYVENHPWPVVFVTVSGAHLYGFASADSDYDLRGMHAAPGDAVLGLDPPRETYEVMEDGEIEMDLVTHDARKFMSMLLGKNGYVLEQVFSPIVVATSPEFEELKDIAARCITRHHRHHFRSFSNHQWKDVEQADKPTVKKLLYAYRPILAGIHLMQTGRVESNLLALNEKFRLSYVDDLIAAKVGGAEKMQAAGVDLKFHRGEIERLRAELEQVSDVSSLPEEPAGRAEMNDLLIRLRHHR